MHPVNQPLYLISVFPDALLDFPWPTCHSISMQCGHEAGPLGCRDGRQAVRNDGMMVQQVCMDMLSFMATNWWLVCSIIYQ